MIKSMSTSQDEILSSIITLYGPIEADITYGSGGFWRHIPQPKLCSDIEPRFGFVKTMDTRHLEYPDHSLQAIACDLPFLTYVRQGRSHNGGKMIMSKAFSGYWTYQELMTHYDQTITECSRVLKRKGILVFKCQDIIHNHRMHCTHAFVCGMGIARGLRLKDMFILYKPNRMPTNPRHKGNQTQRHARIHHSYFLVFEKV
jgi:hypothetical protein